MSLSRPPTCQRPACARRPQTCYVEVAAESKPGPPALLPRSGRGPVAWRETATEKLRFSSALAESRDKQPSRECCVSPTCSVRSWAPERRTTMQDHAKSPTSAKACSHYLHRQLQSRHPPTPNKFSAHIINCRPCFRELVLALLSYLQLFVGQVDSSRTPLPETQRILPFIHDPCKNKQNICCCNPSAQSPNYCGSGDYPAIRSKDPVGPRADFGDSGWVGGFL